MNKIKPPTLCSSSDHVLGQDIYIFIDPAAGGPGSDYGIMSVTRNRGSLVVSACFMLGNLSKLGTPP